MTWRELHWTTDHWTTSNKAHLLMRPSIMWRDFCVLGGVPEGTTVEFAIRVGLRGVYIDDQHHESEVWLDNDGANYRQVVHELPDM